MFTAAISQVWEHSCPGKRFPKRASKDTLSRHWPPLVPQFHKLRISRDWLRPIETPRCRGKGGCDGGGTRDSVREDRRARKNPGNVVKMTNTNFKHKTSTANMMASIPIPFSVLLPWNIFWSIFLPCHRTGQESDIVKKFAFLLRNSWKSVPREEGGNRPKTSQTWAPIVS